VQELKDTMAVVMSDMLTQNQDIMTEMLAKNQKQDRQQQKDKNYIDNSVLSSSASDEADNTSLIATLSGKAITALSKIKAMPLKYHGNYREKTRQFDDWSAQIKTQCYQNKELIMIFAKVDEDRTLTLPEKDWVNISLFYILTSQVDISTRQALDPSRIIPGDGINFWNLLKEQALGDV
jgi:hypothetical protein